MSNEQYKLLITHHSVLTMETLKTGSQFERVRREGRSWGGRLLVLNAAPNGGGIRCGFIAGKKVGGAVQRNRARRLMREAIREQLPRIKQGYDLVLIARAPIVEAKAAEAGSELETLLSRGRLFANPVPLPAQAPIAAPALSATKAVQSRIIERDERPAATAQISPTRALARSLESGLDGEGDNRTPADKAHEQEK